MAMGSRRTTPTWPVAAAVVSEPMVAPTNTPCVQSRLSKTSGARRARRPPKTRAESGTPWGSSHRGDMLGHCRAAAVNRALGWAALPWPSQGLPCQSMRPGGGVLSLPSHHGTPPGVTATLVKIVSWLMVAIAFGLVSGPVPGTTPKKPASGLTAHSRPSGPGRSQAMSSPTVRTLYPALSKGETIMARLVLPHAEGKAAAT